MAKHRITFIPGDGIGPEVSGAARKVVEVAGLSVEWDVHEAGETAANKQGNPLPDATLASIRQNKVALKGPLTTPVGGGFRSVNVGLRHALDLYANVRPAQNMPGVKTRYENVDLMIIRENSEDLYLGIEHKIGDVAAEAIKLITRSGSTRIAKFAFEYAVAKGRKKVTAVHKANILKMTDGLFLECCREVAKGYPNIQFEDRIVDNMCLQLVEEPTQFDLLVLPNLYGDILSDLCAGLVGGLGLAPSGNIGADGAVFEPVHGSAPKYAGQDKVNPSATILTAAMMCDHLGERPIGDRIRAAVTKVLGEGRIRTYDLGGTSKLSEYTSAVCQAL